MDRAPVILGAADGVTIALGLVVSLAGHPAAMWHAALGAGLAELVGMAAGVWLSDRRGGLLPALACGVAALAACVLPAAPYLLLRGTTALGAGLAVTVAAGAVVAWLRPERGFAAAAQTYGVLAAAAGLCWAVGLA